LQFFNISTREKIPFYDKVSFLINEASYMSPSDFDLGLQKDLENIQSLRRRNALGALGSIGSLVLPAWLVGCGGGGSTTATPVPGGITNTTIVSASGSSSCAIVPEETAGPFPGDGSNGANALALTGIVRSDIRASFAGASAVAGGVPLTLTIKLVSNTASCAALKDYAIYLWHCDRDGKYSLYSAGVTNENYLRGVQVTDTNGEVTFTTIIPGCYDGRVPHMHFEVYPSVASTSRFSNKVKTSQLAFPVATMTTIYAGASGYSTSVTNFNKISFASDNVFSDGTTLQMTTMSGTISTGYTAAISVAI
jgi:protocatechuate 3,4-dioxygenase beta subunit